MEEAEIHWNHYHIIHLKSFKLSKPLNDAIPVLLEPQGQSVLAIVLNKVHLITRAPTD